MKSCFYCQFASSPLTFTNPNWDICRCLAPRNHGELRCVYVKVNSHQSCSHFAQRFSARSLYDGIKVVTYSLTQNPKHFHMLIHEFQKSNQLILF